MKNKNNFSISVVLVVVSFLFSNSFAAPTTTSKELLNLEEHHLPRNTENVLQDQDEDVVELESLKHPDKPKTADTLPDLQEQLEAISKASDAETHHHHSHHPMAHQIKEHILEEQPSVEEQPAEETVVETTVAPVTVTAHPPHPHLPHPHMPVSHHGAKTVEHVVPEVVTEEEKEETKPPVKTFPGAARLTFGTHLEIDAINNVETTMAPPVVEETNVDLEVADSSAMLQKRSHNELLTKPVKYDNAETLLRHSGGQYSAFDMAQYVFWTGDEAGVANAIEEFIQEGLMSRENAIKFLRDIRLGIEYLQSTYAHQTSQGMSDEPAGLKHHKATVAPPKPTLSPEVVRALEKLPSLLKLHENSQHKANKDNAIDYDEMAGRLRLADFLYAEYSLEEVIYQLAKVMFTQSLTRGSEQAQTALQRLTSFLESEGVHGRISPALQKKVLDVLLAALSDTLSENPELLTAARMALGGSLKKISNN